MNPNAELVYCTDVDLLHWEPNIFRDASALSELVMSGTGNLIGSDLALTKREGNYPIESAPLVLVLGGEMNGRSFPIAAYADGKMKLDALYDGFPSGAIGIAIHFEVRTFEPLRRMVSNAVRAARPNASIQAARRVCALGTLQCIYNMLAMLIDGGSEREGCRCRAELYQRLFIRALMRVSPVANADEPATIKT